MKTRTLLSIILTLTIAACLTGCLPSVAHAALTKTDYAPSQTESLTVSDATLSYVRYNVSKWMKFKAPLGHNISSTIDCKIYNTPENFTAVKYAIDDELAKNPIMLSTVYNTSFCIAPNNRMRFSIDNICPFRDQLLYESHVRQIIKPILNKTKNLPTKEKLRYFHDWICENTTYDHDAASMLMVYDNSHAWSGYGALVEGKAVCLGYARAFQVLCLSANIDCEIIYSNGDKWRKGHAYNLVHIDNKDLYVDVCSDDSINRYYHDFFLKTKEEMLSTSMSCFYSSAYETADMLHTYHNWRNYLSKDNSYISGMRLPVTKSVSVAAL